MYEAVLSVWTLASAHRIRYAVCMYQLYVLAAARAPCALRVYLIPVRLYIEYVGVEVDCRVSCATCEEPEVRVENDSFT
jgi:hypothetical protein